MPPTEGPTNSYFPTPGPTISPCTPILESNKPSNGKFILDAYECTIAVPIDSAFVATIYCAVERANTPPDANTNESSNAAPYSGAVVRTIASSHFDA
jgi:hypothetical protein